ncbi:MAG: hypothetical protein JW787_01955 [Sedimentisphaerales bacterium]|nr:hypothetical protein [Sedimentisphaerales bacterium]
MKSEDAPLRDENTADKAGDAPVQSHARQAIPKFDLAEQILAGQRKFASMKRTAPSKNRIRNSNVETEIKKQSALNPIPVPAKDNSQDQIISEIVARDIQNFRSGRTKR